MRVVDAMLIRLLIQEVKHVLDGQGQGRATVRCAEDGLKEVVHELLQRALGRRHRSHVAPPGRAQGGFMVCLSWGGETGQSRASLAGTREVHALTLPLPLPLSYISAARGT